MPKLDPSENATVKIALMLKRMRQGFEFSEENFALDLIARVGPSGMFAGEEHTLERMRKTMFLAEIADRDTRAQWKERGALDSQAHAMLKVKEILTRDNPAVFSPEVDARLRSTFPGLVAGDATTPEGWKHVARQESEEEGGERRRRRHARLAVAEG